MKIRNLILGMGLIVTSTVCSSAWPQSYLGQYDKNLAQVNTLKGQQLAAARKAQEDADQRAKSNHSETVHRAMVAALFELKDQKKLLDWDSHFNEYEDFATDQSQLHRPPFLIGGPHISNDDVAWGMIGGILSDGSACSIAIVLYEDDVGAYRAVAKGDCTNGTSQTTFDVWTKALNVSER